MELDFSPEALKERYRIEREKRLRPDGIDQYVDFSGVFADFDGDPYADAEIVRDVIAEEIDVAIVGGGFGGMLSAVRLRQAGVHNFRVIEKGSDFGGTWYWNRYPGAACDVESYIYMPLLEETGYIPTEKYAKAPEIFAHCQRLARAFDLYENAVFQTQVKNAAWDEEKARWQVKTDRGDTLSAKFLIVAGGLFHKQKLPGIPGIEDFKGHSFHTSLWDYDYTGGSPAGNLENLADKRVGIIGTGATSVQAIPHLGASAKQLYVFQRTPSGIGERNNRPTDPEWAKSLQPGWQRERIDNFTAVMSGSKEAVDLIDDGWTAMLNPDSGIPEDEAMDPLDRAQLVDFQNMERVRRRVDAIVRDPVTAEALKPYYNQMCKRPCFHDEYLETFNRPNVTLVDTNGRGVDRITPDGAVVNGVEYELDCLIYASGFETGTSYARRIGFDMVGREGLTLTEAWAKNGTSTLHGVSTRGFPNMMMFSLIQGAFGFNFAHVLVELSRHVAYVVKEALDLGARTVEPTSEAQDAWVGLILGHLAKLPQSQIECTPGYINGEGKRDPSAARNAPFMGGPIEYFRILENWRSEGTLPGLEIIVDTPSASVSETTIA